MISNTIFSYVFVFGVSCLIVYLLVWLFLKTPLSEFFKDPPGKRKIHQRVVPRLGGACLTISFLIMLYLWHLDYFWVLQHLPVNLFDSIVFATLTIFLVGFLDDTYIIEIQNKAKFLLELLIATELVVLLGVRLNTINLFGIVFELGWVGYPLTVLWIVGVANAMNIIDGIDGLAGSVVMVSFLSIAMFAGLAQSQALVTISIVLAGLVAGFLLHNRSPARAFLGDTGSLFLGMILGILSVYIVSFPTANQAPYPILVMFLLVGLPVLDVSAAMFRRYVRAITEGASCKQALASMTVADNGHIHHRLVYRGFQHSEATLFLAFVQATFCVTAMIISQTPPLYSVLAFFYLAVLVTWLLIRLSFLDSLEKLISKRVLSTGVAQNPYDIAVVDADPILKHALTHYQQQDFTFHFQDRQQIKNKTGNQYTAIIISNTQTADYDKDKFIAHHIAALHDCPAILVSDAERGVVPKEKDKDNGVVLHASRPVYIPALLYELFTIAKHKSAGVAIKHNLINITRLQPITGWTTNGKKFPKK